MGEGIMESNCRLAINELKTKLVVMFGGDVELKLFGSVARGDDQKYSDIDVLVLLPGEVDHDIEERVFDAAYDLELKYNVVFGIIVYEKAFWQSDLAAVMPLHRNVEREGLSV
jgi:predicted nucleotidyltransferase